MCTWDKWKEKIKIEDGYTVMMFTDCFEVDCYPVSKEIEEKLQSDFSEKLLDMRVFDKDEEYRIFRGGVDREFIFRHQKDTGVYYDDEQYLDIDYARSKKSFEESRMVKTLTGGYYRLPFEAEGESDIRQELYAKMEEYLVCESMKDHPERGMKIRIRNYLDYDEISRMAYVKDWRLVEFFVENGKEEQNENKEEVE